MNIKLEGMSCSKIWEVNNVLRNLISNQLVNVDLLFESSRITFSLVEELMTRCPPIDKKIMNNHKFVDQIFIRRGGCNDLEF